MKEWHIYIDGASLGNPGDSGAGIVAFDGEGNEVWRDSIYLGHMTNNMAEYEALLRALRRIDELPCSNVHVYTDSLLVANQVTGTYRLRSEGLRPYLEEVRRLIARCSSFKVKHVPRESNQIADRLAKQGSKRRG
jgi:ribonuclease HI